MAAGILPKTKAPFIIYKVTTPTKNYASDAYTYITGQVPQLPGYKHIGIVGIEGVGTYGCGYSDWILESNGNYRIWLAQYNDVATYKGKYYMWQYTSDGSVPGITGRVDMNVAYFSVTNDITKKSEVTGTDGSSSLEEVSFYDADQEVTINKNKELRATPYTNAPNRVGTIEAGTKVILKGVSDQFIKIEHDGNILYIDDPSCYDLPDVEFSELSGTYKTTKRVKVFNIPYDIYNSSTLIDADTVIEVLGKSDKFTKIKQGDKIYYVREFDFYTELTNEPVVVEPEEPVIPSEPVTPSEPETPSIEEPPVEEENTNN